MMKSDDISMAAKESGERFGTIIGIIIIFATLLGMNYPR